MNITAINASVRFSRKVDQSHVTIELSAAADLTPQEAPDWKQAQAKLYNDLAEQMKALWPKKANGSNGHASNGTSPPVDATSPPAHYCHEHQSEFKRYVKGESVWYAHKDGSKWCREKPK